MSELKPCECGSEDVEIKSRWNEREIDVIIECQYCKSCKKYNFHLSDFIDMSRDKAIKLWNIGSEVKE
jgi:hypothetical protein